MDRQIITNSIEVDYINLVEDRNQHLVLVNIYSNELLVSTKCRKFSAFLKNYWLLGKGLTASS
jgi:hypothetical protein